MARFQLLVGKHVQEEEREKLVDGVTQKRIVTCEYAAYDPKRNIVDSSRAVVAARDPSGKVVSCERRDVDLCKKFNQPGFSEKFRKLQEPEQLAQDMNTEDLMRFAKVAIEKGLITAADLKKAAPASSGSPTSVATPTPPTESQQDPLRVAQLKRDLQNIDKTPLIGLQKIAEDEEMDINHCKNAKGEWQEGLVRKAIKTALEARLK